MTNGSGDELRADGKAPGAAGNFQGAARRVLAGWPLSRARPRTPSWMNTELVRLQGAFPAFSFSICWGLRGATFEAWRDPETPGLYALITQDTRELWRELETCQQPVGARPHWHAASYRCPCGFAADDTSEFDQHLDTADGGEPEHFEVLDGWTLQQVRLWQAQPSH
jgi:hypothetical protein